jgi:hypothetical protein
VLVSRMMRPKARDISSMPWIMNPPVPVVRMFGPSSPVSNAVDRPRSRRIASVLALMRLMLPRPSME